MQKVSENIRILAIWDFALNLKFINFVVIMPTMAMRLQKEVG